MKNRPTTYQDHYDNMQSAVRYLNESIAKMREGFKTDGEVISCVDEAEEIVNQLANAVDQLGEEIENIN